MVSFWDSDVWGFINIVSVLLISLLLANILRRKIGFLRKSLVPTSVIGGFILLFISAIYMWTTDDFIFDHKFFSSGSIKGGQILEMITYHAFALGFIASTLKHIPKPRGKKRNTEIFNTGVTTVASEIMQAILGLGFTMLLCACGVGIFEAAGILLPLGFGEGTGQALNFGTVFEQNNGFVNGANFGLAIAAMGFLSASIGGVFHLAIINRKRKKSNIVERCEEYISSDIQDNTEIPMNGSIDKITVQLAFIMLAYILAYGLMFGLSALLPDLKAQIYGFNFLVGVITATLIKFVMNLLKKVKLMNREYLNNFLLTRIGNFFFDIMVVAGVAAINTSLLGEHIWILLALSIIGIVFTYAYNYFIAKKMFPEYAEEQFLVMYGMLTGTASTGMVLLREIDGKFETPAADNLVYQNFPAIIFGFPMMMLVPKAAEDPLKIFLILIAFFLVMNIILFRSFIFKKLFKRGKTLACDGVAATGSDGENNFDNNSDNTIANTDNSGNEDNEND